MADAPEPTPLALVPQQPRSRATQDRILDAALHLLAEKGYEGFTTGAVSRRASVSKGSLFQHFPTKELLLVATVERVFERQRRRYRRATTRLEGTQSERRSRAVRLLWRVLSNHEYLASLQIFGASRTNPKLAEVLIPVATEQLGRTEALGIDLLVSLGVPPTADIRGLLTTLLFTLEGMAKDPRFRRESALREEVFGILEQLVVTEAASASHAKPDRKGRS